MSQQHLFVLVLFLFMFALITAVFIHVYRSSLAAAKETGAQGMATPNRKRFLLFSILAAVLLIMLSVTLQDTPYYTYADEEPAQVVFVGTRQFSFTMSRHAPDPATNTMKGEAIVLPAGEVVEFRVMSSDVNHGFAIYDPHNQLIAQTQAMPGYVNRLRWKFDRPGTYKVHCLEFCGMAHNVMGTSFAIQ